MTKSARATFEGVLSLVQEQGTQMETLRAALNIQFKRIAQMQAELDALPKARRRRETFFARSVAAPSHNGNGRVHQ